MQPQTVNSVVTAERLTKVVYTQYLTLTSTQTPSKWTQNQQNPVVGSRQYNDFMQLGTIVAHANGESARHEILPGTTLP